MTGWSWGEWSEWNVGGEFWGGLLESGCFMLIGMMLFRLRILTGEAPAATHRWMMLAGYGGGGAMRGAMIALKARYGCDLVPASIAWRSCCPMRCVTIGVWLVTGASRRRGCGGAT